MLPKSGRRNQLPAASDDEQVVPCSADRPWHQYTPTWCTGPPLDQIEEGAGSSHESFVDL